MHLAQELLTNIQFSGGSRSFAKETRALKMNSIVAGHPKRTVTKLRAIMEADPLTAALEVAKELDVTHSITVFGIWNKVERWKSSISGCLMSWLQIKKIVYTTTMNHFSIRSWCAMKSRFYTATGYEQLSGWTKKKLQTTSQSQTYTQKRVMVTLCWSAASLIHYSFLNPDETIISEAYAQQIDGKWEWKC